jgi:hypothetical protein
MSTAHKDNTKVVKFLNKLGGKKLPVSKEDMVYFIFIQESL